MLASLLDASSLAAGSSCAMFTMWSCSHPEHGLLCTTHIRNNGGGMIKIKSSAGLGRRQAGCKNHRQPGGRDDRLACRMTHRVCVRLQPVLVLRLLESAAR